MNVFVLLAACLLTAAAVQPRPFALSDYRWKHRLLLVFAPDADKASRQIALLQTDVAGVQQRNLLVIYVIARPGSLGNGRKLTGPDVRMLRRQFRIGAGDFGVVLVGKDGGEKHRWHEPVDVKKIYAVIDAMPMRQAEMQRGPAEGRP